MDLSVPKSSPSDKEEQQIKCKFCEFICDDKLEWLSHLNTHMDLISQEYDDLQESCTDPARFISNDRNNENDDVLSCGICNYSCSDKQLMDIHMNVHADFVIKEEDFEDVSNGGSPVMNGSGESEEGPKIFKCDQCHFECTDESFLTIHKVMHTFTKEVENNIKFIQSQEKVEENDNRKIDDNKPFSCHICHKSFTVKSSLKQHMRLHTGDTPHRCHICNHPFSQKSHLDRHVKTHTGEKKHKCELCEYATSEIANLMCHMRKHTGERPYKCDLCGLTFKQKIGLDRHRKRHSGNKPFKCLLCDYACYDSSSLIRHTRVHTGEKPFKCPECDYTCANNNNLISHRKIHSNEKPHKCEYCGHALRRRSDLRRHTKRNHPDKPLPDPVRRTNIVIPVITKAEKNSHNSEESHSCESSPVCLSIP